MSVQTAPHIEPADNAPPSEPEAKRPSRRIDHRRLGRPLEVLILALLAYVPLLVSRPGVITPDTKTYLYLDPTKFLRQVASMWDPTVALGTVTHEYVGYLFPMGPFFLIFHALGVPVWIAQRLWLGSIMFGAGVGVLFLCKTLGVRGPGRTVGALAFMLSPYVLQYAGRISVLLLPWAGLPWMIAFTARALRGRGWRDPALFAIVVALTSSINASSIIYVGIAPVLWILYATAIEHECSWFRALVTTMKIGLLTLGVSLWWMVGLVIEAGYGVDVLKYTETVMATSGGSSSSEVIRGLGYWYFYGSDRLGPWTKSAVLYTQQIPVIVLSYCVPVAAFIASAFFRWRLRAYFIFLVVVGMTLSVGAHPYDSPTFVGGLLKTFMTQTTAGLAMRSTDRATPLVVLGMAMVLGAGVSALWSRFSAAGIAVAVVVGGLVITANPALFNGDTIANDFTQPASLPASQMAAIRYLNSVNPQQRVLAIPGNDFASFRWGNTVDAPQPAFLNRPFVIHEQQIMGSMATADLLYALDDPIQENTENPSALAPLARLMSASNLLVENDTQYEHYGLPDPQAIAQLLTPTPSGLDDPRSFGKPSINRSSIPSLDEQDLASPTPPRPLAPVVVYTVPGARPITRAESDEGALLVSGDATGLQDLASAGLLNTNSAIYYSGTLAKDPARIRSLMAKGAGLIVTDTNRKQGFRWDTIAGSQGATETADENPQRTDPTDNPITLFPAAGLNAKTVATYVGASSVLASSYGTPFSYVPEDRAAGALDGNLDTAWRTGIFTDPVGQWWQVSFQAPTTTDHITLIQPQNGDLARWITKVRVTFDGRASRIVTLGPSSRSATGQVISFPTTTFSTLRISIVHTSDDGAPPAQATAVGLAEVEIPGHTVTEVLSMPSDLLDAAGAASIFNRLTVVMTRWTSSPYPTRFDPETTISREFTLPTTRTMTVSGTASLSTLIPDDEIDRLVGLTPGVDGQPVAYSSGRLPGGLFNRASATIDGNPATYWQPGFGASSQIGSWLEYDVREPITFSTMNLQVVADGRHSVPTTLTVSTADGSRTVAIPRIKDSTTPNAVTTVPLHFAPLTGSQIKVTFDTVRLVRTTNYNSPIPLAEPIGIAEVGIPGLSGGAAPATLPGTCQDNLLFINGAPIPVRIVGSTTTALRNQTVSVQACGSTASGVTLPAGRNVVTTALGHTESTGWNLDQVVLDSAPGGGPAAAPTNGTLDATQSGPTPTTVVSNQTPTSQTVHVTGVSGSFELVLGQSVNAGWQAIATSAAGSTHPGASVNLGRSELIDGFANGWHVTKTQLRALGITPSQAAAGGGAITIALTWTPQRSMWIALFLSGLALLGCILLSVLPWLRARRRRWSQARALSAATASDGAPQPPDAEGDDNGAPAVLQATAVARTTEALSSPSTAQELSSDGRTLETEAPAKRQDVQALVRPALVEDAPTLTWPGARVGHRAPLWMIAIAAVVTGAVGAGIAAPWVGALAALLVVAAALVPRIQGLASIGAVGLLLAAVVNVVSLQMHDRFLVGDWPSHFNTAGSLTWAAVVLLGADGVIGILRARPSKRSGSHAKRS